MAQGAGEVAQTMRGPTETTAFRSSRVVTPDGVAAHTILVRDGRIASILGWDAVPSHAELRDFGSAVLLPGLVDTHVHINEPGRTDWEGFATATHAAAAGGVTTLVDMPLNCIPETITASALEAKRVAASGSDGHSEGKAWVDWMAWGGVVGNRGVGGNEADLPGLIAAGVPGFKCFLVDSGIDGFAWVDELQLRRALAVLEGSGLPLLAHAEVAGPVDRATSEINEPGRDSDWRRYAIYLASRPDQAELEAIELLIRLAGEFDTPIHIVHLASAQALPMLRKARAEGFQISVETCPQYLWFSAETIPDGATEFKCAPPIREGANREALWQALFEGTIDLIATDHSPCPPELKHRDSGRFDQAWGGVASLGLALSIVWTGMQSNASSEMSFESRLANVTRWMAMEPARLAGLTGKKGALAVGYDADISVFEPETEWTVTQSDLFFRHKISPYLGTKLLGRVIETYLRGERVFRRPCATNPGDRCEFSAQPEGREVRRSL